MKSQWRQSEHMNKRLQARLLSSISHRQVSRSLKENARRGTHPNPSIDYCLRRVQIKEICC